MEPSSAHPAAVSAEGDVGAPGPGFGGDIALCLSGGGYRAAAFHLGVLDLLDRAGLLERVRTLSTISGGTLVGAAWALSCARDEAFSSFFARLWATLRDCNVVRDAVASLAQGAGGRPPSLIRAAAGVYGTPGFVGDAKLGELMASAAGPDELVFSATEFHSGRAYRFQTSRRSKARVGNLPPLAIPSAVAKEIRLADIMAASSCFPGAFEPLIFPRDFGWEDRPAIEQALGERFPPVPLMDGGIYDNQGVDGAVTVYDRGDLFEQLGLFLVSDTSQRLEPLFRESPALPGPPLRIRTLGWIARAVFALALLSSLALSYELLTARWSWATAPRLLVTGLVPAVLGAATAFSLWYGRRWLRRALDHLRTTTRVTLLPFLARLDTGDAIELIARRLRSTMAMVSQVSMKRVRRLIQESLLAESSPFRPRTALNLIYDLDRERSALWSRQPGLRPSAALRDLARRAEQVPTTLWLDNEEQLRDLLACGQATTCANLLGHLYERCLPALTDPASVESRVVAALTPLWEQLQAQPYALLERP